MVCRNRNCCAQNKKRSYSTVFKSESHELQIPGRFCVSHCSPGGFLIQSTKSIQVFIFCYQLLNFRMTRIHSTHWIYRSTKPTLEQFVLLHEYLEKFCYAERGLLVSRADSGLGNAPWTVVYYLGICSRRRTGAFTTLLRDGWKQGRAQGELWDLGSFIKAL